MPLHPFHLAIPVHDLAPARAFYGDLLGCPEGRSDADWVDFDFHGHQLVVHRIGTTDSTAHPAQHNPVDGAPVPVPHFGLVLPMADWQALADRLTAAGCRFVMAPRVRFAGTPGEQATFFLADPSGNHLEMKAMADPANLFA